MRAFGKCHTWGDACGDMGTLERELTDPIAMNAALLLPRMPWLSEG